MLRGWFSDLKSLYKPSQIFAAEVQIFLNLCLGEVLLVSWWLQLGWRGGEGSEGRTAEVREGEDYRERAKLHHTLSTEKTFHAPGFVLWKQLTFDQLLPVWCVKKMSLFWDPKQIMKFILLQLCECYGLTKYFQEGFVTFINFLPVMICWVRKRDHRAVFLKYDKLYFSRLSDIW